MRGDREGIAGLAMREDHGERPVVVASGDREGTGGLAMRGEGRARVAVREDCKASGAAFVRGDSEVRPGAAMGHEAWP